MLGMLVSSASFVDVAQVGFVQVYDAGTKTEVFFGSLVIVSTNKVAPSAEGRAAITETY
jgi:hypothetical protein